MDAMVDYYISTEDIRLCPVAKKLANPDMQELPGTNPTWGSTFIGWGKVLPSDTAAGGTTTGFYGSYGINGYLYVSGVRVLYGKPAERFWRTPNPDEPEPNR